MVGFAMVMPLFLLVALALLGLAMTLHARMILVDSAAEGARVGAVGGTALAEQRTRELITAALPAEYAQDVVASESVIGGVAILRVEVTAPLPVPGMPGALEVQADAPIE
ncbi:MAG: TadE/TadG family type IV pilus assembly protein [Ancrocorticia sp.]|uniref:TadE/TadG family type IV pilus assembly protein n=1 Tax=Ancrocorticia sp. TaxID=2593684 RepID=UPI003F8F867C